MNIALITGASSGLGREFARQVSRDPHVQAVWAVARREDRLRQLASLCACPVRPVPLDLTDPQSLDALRDLLAREKPTVTRLVCAAGVGKMGRIDAVSPAYNFVYLDIASEDTKLFNQKYHIYPNLPYVLLFKDRGRISRYLQKNCINDEACFTEKLNFFAN